MRGSRKFSPGLGSDSDLPLQNSLYTRVCRTKFCVPWEIEGGGGGSGPPMQ